MMELSCRTIWDNTCLYLSLSSTIGAATGVGAMGSNFLSTLDFENELIHAIMMNDGGGSGSKSGNGNGIENRWRVEWE